MNRLMCQALAIILLLSGMCFQNIETHSSFVYSLEQKGESLEEKGHWPVSQVSDIPEISEESMEEFSDVIIKNVRSKFNFDLLQSMYLCRFSLQNLTNSSMALQSNQEGNPSVTRAIINVIHYSDGKK